MKATAKKLVLHTVGWAFIALGIVGLFLPVLQGILFLLIGLTVLSSEYAWAHNLLNKARDRFPAIACRCDQAVRKVHVWMERVYSQR